MWFRSSEGDQVRKGAVITRVRAGPRGRHEAGGGGCGSHDRVVVVLPCSPFFMPRWSLWMCRVDAGLCGLNHQAVVTLRQMVALAGLPPEEYLLHSLRIRGGTYLASAGATPAVVLRKGRR